MLGFGLLGAAISSFVREQVTRKDKDQNEPLVKDLVGVLVRGLSAAVVIFLAVVGGLAIFTEGAQQPNAYVLFFTCLVGAVFSDDVWIWARKKLGDNLTGDKEEKETEKTKDPKE
ncbi:hypothetical protein [Rhodohalobacter sulfatireducens]|uniref:Uncharacterized protein n=1 Tax=Rhodohalobacter sulfatireducens TaxID=2911366 RepID=A0ABS9KE61_9BACT|nr:hypothetical protein [Rhodohalobacter sulfatireducens]MCG2589126.1 hypothetical protein [Rhodohalobacter sulfatireducens]